MHMTILQPILQSLCQSGISQAEPKGQCADRFIKPIALYPEIMQKKRHGDEGSDHGEGPDQYRRHYGKLDSSNANGAVGIYAFNGRDRWRQALGDGALTVQWCSGQVILHWRIAWPIS